MIICIDNISLFSLFLYPHCISYFLFQYLYISKSMFFCLRIFVYRDMRSQSFAYTTPWDAYKINGCVCDNSRTSYDCIELSCPVGDDPLTLSQVDALVYWRCDLQVYKCRERERCYVYDFSGCISMIDLLHSFGIETVDMWYCILLHLAMSDISLMAVCLYFYAGNMWGTLSIHTDIKYMYRCMYMHVHLVVLRFFLIPCLIYLMDWVLGYLNILTRSFILHFL